MSDASARLGLPHILPSQAQKHVTHNEAIEILDALVHLTLESRGLEAPPLSPQPGQAWYLGATPSDAWSGQGGMIARWDVSGWRFILPVVGLRAWDATTQDLLVYTGSAWQSVSGVLENLDGIGIGTTSDATNRLAVSSDATLLSHNGASHQLKVNKAATADTASLLFQSNWTGHAEMGLAGEADFSVKVSADGSAWTTAITFDAATGYATGDAIQSDATDLVADKLARVGTTYGPGNLIGTVSQSGGTPTGAVIEQGQTADGHFIRFADGTQICWADDFAVFAAAEAILQETWTFPAAFIAAPAVSYSLSLVNADWTGVARNTISTWGAIGAPTTTGVQLAIYPAAGTGAVTGSVANTCPVAIGRWF